MPQLDSGVAGSLGCAFVFRMIYTSFSNSCPTTSNLPNPSVMRSAPNEAVACVPNNLGLPMNGTYSRKAGRLPRILLQMMPCPPATAVADHSGAVCH